MHLYGPSQLSMGRRMHLLAIMAFISTRFVCFATPGDPTTDCPDYVVEGDTLNCNCFPPEAVRPHDFSLTWSDGSSSDNLVKNDVSRRDNNTLFKCKMTWNREIKTVSYTLRVAYGPRSVTINGPAIFVTNGSRVMTLTCEASDVYPPPGYVWSGDVSCTNITSNVCRLTPKGSLHHGKKVKCTATSSFFVTKPVVATHEYSLNLQYPPASSPQIKPKSDEQGESITCTVSGGNPPVSSVNMSCYGINSTQSLPWLTSSTNTTVVTEYVNCSSFDKGLNLSCTCGAFWKPESDLYKQSSQYVISVPCENSKNTKVPNVSGSAQNGKRQSVKHIIFYIYFHLTLMLLAMV